MAKGKAHYEWVKANTMDAKFRLSKISDADIIAHLEKQESKQGYIKRLIRQDIEAQRKG